jgi:acyl dehydratase
VRSVVQNVLNNEAGRVESVQLRFTSHVFPGEALKIKLWKEENRLYFEAWTVERKTKAAQGIIGLREQSKL